MTTQQCDYYDVLGASRDANAQTIKDAFRQLALRYHPDRNKEPDAEERFKEIAEAYAVLSDTEKRAAYDAGGFAGVGSFSPADLFSQLNVEDILGGLGLGGFDLGGGGLFDRIFRRRSSGPPRSADLEVVLEVAHAPQPRGKKGWLLLDSRVVGLHAVECMWQAAAQSRTATRPEVRAQLEALRRYVPLGEQIESFWREPEHQRASLWSEHRDINEVMLATRLVPNGFLVLA
jgi:hypothetical protein